MYPSPCLVRLINPYKLVFYEADDELGEIVRESDTKDNFFEQSTDYEHDTCSIQKACSPDDRFQYVNQFINNKFDFNNNLLDSLQKYNRRKKRQLPKIPANKQPLGSLIGSDLKQKNKITKHISTNLSLQIELNEERKPISLQLIDLEFANFKKLNESLNGSINEADYKPLSEELKTSAPFQSPVKASNKIEGNYRGLHKFIARHDDEISIEVGDSIYVIKQEDDLWFKGINLATNVTGYFPSLYVIDCNYNELFQTVNYFDSTDDDSGLNCECSNDYACTDLIDTGRQQWTAQKEQFYLEFLGSLEVAKPKGNEVLEQCIRKVVQTHLKQANNQAAERQLTSFLCVLEIDSFGIRFRKQEANDSSIQPAADSASSVTSDESMDRCLSSDEHHQNEEIDEFKKRIENEYDIIDINLNSVQTPVKSRPHQRTPVKNEKSDPVRKVQLEKESTKQINSATTKLTQSSPVKQSPVYQNSQSTRHLNQLISTDDDYFFHLKNITYCGTWDQYFAFITKHPKLKQKYASHVFNAQTVQVSKMLEDSIGKAFKQFYLNYIELSQNIVN